MAASRVSICNLAIARLPAKAIATYEENSLEARECRRHYPQVIDEMLQGPHTWSFQIQRVELAALASNDREHEWLHAYQVPANMGHAIQLMPNLDAVGGGYPVPLPGEPYREVWGGVSQQFGVPYIISGSTIYSNQESAILEFGVNSVEEASLPPLVVNAISAELAARIAIPVKQDRKLKAELAEEAEIAWQRAMAEDQNRHPRQSGNYISETMLARAGAL